MNNERLVATRNRRRRVIDAYTLCRGARAAGYYGAYSVQATTREGGESANLDFFGAIIGSGEDGK
eukprot:scaffold213190_cov21-Prasinocladus_malaysianus.AAC.1